MRKHHRLTPIHVLKITALMALLGGAYLLVAFLNLETLLNPGHLAEYLDSWGWVAPGALIIMMAAAVVISPIPSLPLDLAAGMAFGPMMGALYAVIGAEIGAIAGFLIGRALGREVISRLLRINVVFCEKCSDHHLMGLIFLARLLPIFSFDIISYGAGLTNMSLRAFALATFVGMIPPTFALTSLGGSLFIVEWPLVLLGLALAALFLFLPKLILTNRSTWWVKLLQGPSPVSGQTSEPKSATGKPIHGSGEFPPERCPSCGGAL